jgi:hypothetical protein
MWRLPPNRVRVLDEPISADEARIALYETATGEQFKSLLVCISTHGRRFDSDLGPQDLHLALSTSRADIPGTHWRFSEISRVLQRVRRERNADILLIVDACYSETLTLVPEYDAQSGESAESLRLTVPRVTVLSATRDRRVAWPHWPVRDPDGCWRRESDGETLADSGYTAFLGALIETFEEGISGQPRILTAGHVFDDALRRIEEAQRAQNRIPYPGKNTDGNGEIALCVNLLYKAPPPSAVGEPAEHGTPLLAADCFSRLQALSDAGKRKLLWDFCQGGEVPVGQVAALAAMLEASELSDYLKVAYKDFCTARSPDEIAVLVHRLHEEASRADEHEIIASLRTRDGRVAAAAHVSILRSGCPECKESAEVMADLIMGDEMLRGAAAAFWPYGDPEGTAV